MKLEDKIIEACEKKGFISNYSLFRTGFEAGANWAINELMSWKDVNNELPKVNTDKVLIEIIYRNHKSNEIKSLQLCNGLTEDQIQIIMISNFVSHWRYINIEDYDI